MFFTAINQMMTEGVDLTLVIRKANGQLAVSTLPKSNGLKDEAQNHIVPLTVNGKPEELDAGFLQTVARPIQKAVGLITNMAQFEVQAEKAASESKATCRPPACTAGSQTVRAGTGYSPRRSVGNPDRRGNRQRSASVRIFRLWKDMLPCLYATSGRPFLHYGRRETGVCQPVQADPSGRRSGKGIPSISQCLLLIYKLFSAGESTISGCDYPAECPAGQEPPHRTDIRCL